MKALRVTCGVCILIGVLYALYLGRWREAAAWWTALTWWSIAGRQTGAGK